MEEGGIYDSLEYQGKTTEQVRSSFKIAVCSIIAALISLLVAGAVLAFKTLATIV